MMRSHLHLVYLLGCLLLQSFNAGVIYKIIQRYIARSTQQGRIDVFFLEFHKDLIQTFVNLSCGKAVSECAEKAKQLTYLSLPVLKFRDGTLKTVVTHP